MHYWINDIRADHRRQREGHDRALAARHALRPFDRRPGQRRLPDRHRRHHRRAPPDWPQPPRTRRGRTRSTTSGTPRVNSRGKYFNAPTRSSWRRASSARWPTSPAQTARPPRWALAGAQLTATKKFGYRTSYETGWWGDVKKYALDPNTGALPVDANGNPIERAGVVGRGATRRAGAAGTGLGHQPPDRDDQRSSATPRSPFRLANLSAAQQASLNAGWSHRDAHAHRRRPCSTILRGDKSNEGVGTTNFRVRSHILGDIVYSAAVPVGAPSQPYDDTGNPGYTAFARRKASRTPMVYVGANDGMLHAFIDSTPPPMPARKPGRSFPKALFSAGDPNDTTHTPSPEFQLGALELSRRRAFRFLVTSSTSTPRRASGTSISPTPTPTTPPTTGNDWRTMLVGGLGAGGRAVYALDVTTPVALTDTEADIASSKRVLWEFTDAEPGLRLRRADARQDEALTAGWRWSPPATTIRAARAILYVLNPKRRRIDS